MINQAPTSLNLCFYTILEKYEQAK